jgi:hypothetical protein
MMKQQHNRVATALLLTAVLVMGPEAASAQTEIFRSMTNERCSTSSRDDVANAARLNVESHVTRAEASIQPPTPVGDLSCLNDLMNIDIDFLSGQFFSLDSLLGDFMSGLQNITLEGIGEEVNRQICAFAQEKWSELTEPLNLSVGDLLGDVSPDFTSNFALLNVSPGQPGSGVTVNGGGAPSVTAPPTSTGAPDVQDAINQIYNSLNGGN